MKKVQKISWIELVVLFTMIMCYVAALYMQVCNNRNAALTLFALHGVLTMAYFYISQDRFAQALLDEKELTHDREKLLDTDKIQSANGFKKEKEELEKKIEELTKLLDENKKEKIELQSMMQQKDENLNQIYKSEKYNQLLPQGEQESNYDLLELIREVFSRFDTECRKNGIRLELATSFECLTMNCDKRYIVTALSNIVDNSIKYMNRSGSLVVTISDIGDEGIFVVCKDNGEGLPKAEVPYIFKLNYQGSNRKNGNGLGLAQVKAIVEHYNGTVYAKSDTEQGMAIYIQFPITNKG